MEENGRFSPRDQELLILSVKRFEVMIRHKDQYFFDVDTLLNISDHFTGSGELKKALHACDYALSIHPNSTDCMLKKSSDISF